MNTHLTSIVVVALLVGLGLYRRMQRTIGFQKFVRRRMVTRMVMLSVIGVMMVAIGFTHPMVYLYDALGVALGGVLAYYAMRTTSFDRRDDGWYYRPHPWIGIVLLILLVARVAWRLYGLDTAVGTPTGPGAGASEQATYLHEPLTAGVFFALITYYVAYYTFLLRRERHLEQETP
ncbi:MAG: DUF1453 family protein [Alicyclobacillaceae bacterium]|nr:DUF1453 family protein [Alicyclobacillaceae bacterium]